MEAQGNLLADYWALSQFGAAAPFINEMKHFGDIKLFEQVLSLFKASPGDKRNLPGGADMSSIINWVLVGSALAIASVPHNSSAMSRIGRAEVKVVDGVPCFSIPNTGETQNGVPLYSILLSETQSTDENSLPAPLWHLVVLPYGKSVLLTAQECVRYGQTLPGTVLKISKELKPLHVYSIHLNARPDGSDLMGYDAQFCVIRRGKDEIVVKIVDSDEQGVVSGNCQK